MQKTKKEEHNLSSAPMVCVLRCIRAKSRPKGRLRSDMPTAVGVELLALILRRPAPPARGLAFAYDVQKQKEYYLSIVLFGPSVEIRTQGNRVLPH